LFQPLGGETKEEVGPEGEEDCLGWIPFAGAEVACEEEGEEEEEGADRAEGRTLSGFTTSQVSYPMNFTLNRPSRYILSIVTLGRCWKKEGKRVPLL